jgi:S1-C subfamily serine protease
MTFARALCLLLVAAALARPAPADDEPLPTLEDGAPLAVALKQGRSTWSGRFTVPADARAVAVVATADGDVDLFLKQGRPVFEDFEAEADAFRRSEGAAEVLVLGGEGRPAPAEGPWFVTLEHPRAAFRGMTAQVVVLIERAGGARTVLPEHPVTASVGEGEIPLLRTFVPSGARGLKLTLTGRGVEGAEVEVRGPDGASRRTPATQAVLVEADEVAPGAWTFRLLPPAPPGPARKVTAEVSWTLPPVPAPSDAPLLQPGKAQLVLMGGDSPHARLLRVVVPEGWQGFSIEEHNDAKADVDLYVRRDAPPENPENDADWLAVTSSSAERIVVAGQRPLAPGTYFVHVSIYVEGPVLSSLALRAFPVRPTPAGEPAPAAEGLKTWGAGDPPILAAGTWVRGRTDPAKSGIAWFGVDPPAGTRSLHALLLDSAAPLELILARQSDGSVLSRAVTGRVDERLDHAFPAPLPAERRFLIGVLCLTPGEAPADFRLALGFDAPPALPQDLLWPRLLPLEGLSPAERVAAATVELTGQRSGGGSATCISPRGLLLSCRHVLRDPEEPGQLQRDGILVAFNRSLDRPPAQCYVARVIYDDVTLDMALLELTEDVFGRALPADLALPWVALGDSDALRLGEPVTVFGYPQEGSEFTRTPVILSRGSVSGFESAGGQRSWIKTDAWIGPGHSGGTVVDKDYQLVAVPAATLGGFEAMGRAVPGARLPAAWRQRLARDLPPKEKTPGDR